MCHKRDVAQLPTYVVFMPMTLEYPARRSINLDVFVAAAAFDKPSPEAIAKPTRTSRVSAKPMEAVPDIAKPDQEPTVGIDTTPTNIDDWGPLRRSKQRRQAKARSSPGNPHDKRWNMHDDVRLREVEGGGEGRVVLFRDARDLRGRQKEGPGLALVMDLRWTSMVF